MPLIPNNIKPVLPPRLRKGDTIGLFCPAGPVKDIRAFEDEINLIKELGFKVKLHGAFQNNGHYLADDDAARAKSLHALWDDGNVQAVMAIRGGFGSVRMMKYIDLDRLQRNPKMLIGFSDVSALLSALIGHANLVAVHGPVVTSLTLHDQQSVHQLFSLLTGEAEDSIGAKGMEILRGGNRRGRILGGNLTTLVHLIGTPWDCSWDDALLVLEDTGETFYRLDRMLTQLAFSGRLDRLAGLILGTFDPGNPDRLEILRLQEQVWQRVLELTQQYDFPVWGNFPVGHQTANFALPMGMEATMDSQSGKLRLHSDSVQVL